MCLEPFRRVEICGDEEASAICYHNVYVTRMEHVGWQQKEKHQFSGRLLHDHSLRNISNVIFNISRGKQVVLTRLKRLVDRESEGEGGMEELPAPAQRAV